MKRMLDPAYEADRRKKVAAACKRRRVVKKTEVDQQRQTLAVNTAAAAFVPRVRDGILPGDLAGAESLSKAMLAKLQAVVHPESGTSAWTAMMRMRRARTVCIAALFLVLEERGVMASMTQDDFLQAADITLVSLYHSANALRRILAGDLTDVDLGLPATSRKAAVDTTSTQTEDATSRHAVIMIDLGGIRQEIRLEMKALAQVSHFLSNLVAAHAPNDGREIQPTRTPAAAR